MSCKANSNRPSPLDLSLVIPCYNEADVIRSTAIRLLEAFNRNNIDVELVLVDNGSADSTGKIIDEMISEELPISKVTVRVNQGYGYGVLSGFPTCKGRFIGFACADGQVAAEDVVRVYEIAANAKVPTLVKVRRRFRMDGFTRKIVSIIYNVLINTLFWGLRSIDINGNPKIFPKEYVHLMRLQSKDWFLDAEVMIKARRLGLEIYEFNVMAQMREGGASNVHSSTCWEFIVNLIKCKLGFGDMLDIPLQKSPKSRNIFDQAK